MSIASKQPIKQQIWNPELQSLHMMRPENAWLFLVDPIIKHISETIIH